MSDQVENCAKCGKFPWDCSCVVAPASDGLIWSNPDSEETKRIKQFTELAKAKIDTLQAENNALREALGDLVEQITKPNDPSCTAPDEAVIQNAIEAISGLPPSASTWDDAVRAAAKIAYTHGSCHAVNPCNKAIGDEIYHSLTTALSNTTGEKDE